MSFFATELEFSHLRPKLGLSNVDKLLLESLQDWRENLNSNLGAIQKGRPHREGGRGVAQSRHTKGCCVDLLL